MASSKAAAQNNDKDVMAAITQGIAETTTLNCKRLSLLDLSRVQQKANATDNDVEDYKRFLALRGAMAKHTKSCEMVLLSPTDNMDCMWHHHILDTQSYKTACELMLGNGGFVHHDPYAGKDVGVRTARREMLKSTWMRVYSEPPKEGWGPPPSADGGVERMKKRKLSEVEKDKSYPVYVKTLLGKTVALTVDDNTNGADLKQMIYNKEGIPPDQQRLIFAGRQFRDDETLTERSPPVKEESTMHLVLKLGGC